MSEKLQVKQEFNGVTRQYLNFRTDSIYDLDKSQKRIKTCYALKGDAFNQQLQSLINKYPAIQKNMKSEFIAYYDKEKNRETVKNCTFWYLQKSINDIMQSYPSTKFVQFYKDDVSPSMVDGNGRLKSDTNVISIRR